MRRIPSEPSGEFDSGLEAQLKQALSSSVKEGEVQAEALNREIAKLEESVRRTFAQNPELIEPAFMAVFEQLIAEGVVDFVSTDEVHAMFGTLTAIKEMEESAMFALILEKGESGAFVVDTKVETQVKHATLNDQAHTLMMQPFYRQRMANDSFVLKAKAGLQSAVLTLLGYNLEAEDAFTNADFIKAAELLYTNSIIFPSNLKLNDEQKRILECVRYGAKLKVLDNGRFLVKPPIAAIKAFVYSDDFRRHDWQSGFDSLDRWGSESSVMTSGMEPRAKIRQIRRGLVLDSEGLQSDNLRTLLRAHLTQRFNNETDYVGYVVATAFANNMFSSYLEPSEIRNRIRYFDPEMKDVFAKQVMKVYKRKSSEKLPIQTVLNLAILTEDENTEYSIPYFISRGFEGVLEEGVQSALDYLNNSNANFNFSQNGFDVSLNMKSNSYLSRDIVFFDNKLVPVESSLGLSYMDVYNCYKSICTPGSSRQVDQLESDEAESAESLPLQMENDYGIRFAIVQKIMQEPQLSMDKLVFEAGYKVLYSDPTLDIHLDCARDEFLDKLNLPEEVDVPAPAPEVEEQEAAKPDVKEEEVTKPDDKEKEAEITEDKVVETVKDESTPKLAAKPQVQPKSVVLDEDTQEPEPKQESKQEPKPKPEPKPAPAVQSKTTPEPKPDLKQPAPKSTPKPEEKPEKAEVPPQPKEPEAPKQPDADPVVPVAEVEPDVVPPVVVTPTQPKLPDSPEQEEASSEGESVDGIGSMGSVTDLSAPVRVQLVDERSRVIENLDSLRRSKTQDLREAQDYVEAFVNPEIEAPKLPEEPEALSISLAGIERANFSDIFDRVQETFGFQDMSFLQFSYQRVKEGDEFKVDQTKSIGMIVSVTHNGQREVRYIELEAPSNYEFNRVDFSVNRDPATKGAVVFRPGSIYTYLLRQGFAIVNNQDAETDLSSATEWGGRKVQLRVGEHLSSAFEMRAGASAGSARSMSSALLPLQTKAGAFDSNTQVSFMKNAASFFAPKSQVLSLTPETSNYMQSVRDQLEKEFPRFDPQIMSFDIHQSKGETSYGVYVNISRREKRELLYVPIECSDPKSVEFVKSQERKDLKSTLFKSKQLKHYLRLGVRLATRPQVGLDLNNFENWIGRDVTLLVRNIDSIEFQLRADQKTGVILDMADIKRVVDRKQKLNLRIVAEGQRILGMVTFGDVFSKERPMFKLVDGRWILYKAKSDTVEEFALNFLKLRDGLKVVQSWFELHYEYILNVLNPPRVEGEPYFITCFKAALNKDPKFTGAPMTLKLVEQSSDSNSKIVLFAGDRMQVQAERTVSIETSTDVDKSTFVSSLKEQSQSQLVPTVTEEITRPLVRSLIGAVKPSQYSGVKYESLIMSKAPLLSFRDNLPKQADQEKVLEWIKSTYSPANILGFVQRFNKDQKLVKKPQISEDALLNKDFLEFVLKEVFEAYKKLFYYVLKYKPKLEGDSLKNYNSLKDVFATKFNVDSNGFFSALLFNPPSKILAKLDRNELKIYLSVIRDVMLDRDLQKVLKCLDITFLSTGEFVPYESMSSQDLRPHPKLQELKSTGLIQLNSDNQVVSLNGKPVQTPFILTPDLSVTVASNYSKLSLRFAGKSFTIWNNPTGGKSGRVFASACQKFQSIVESTSPVLGIEDIMLEEAGVLNFNSQYIDSVFVFKSTFSSTKPSFKRTDEFTVHSSEKLADGTFESYITIESESETAVMIVKSKSELQVTTSGSGSERLEPSEESSLDYVEIKDVNFFSRNARKIGNLRTIFSKFQILTGPGVTSAYELLSNIIKYNLWYVIHSQSQAKIPYVDLKMDGDQAVGFKTHPLGEWISIDQAQNYTQLYQQETTSKNLIDNSRLQFELMKSLLSSISLSVTLSDGLLRIDQGGGNVFLGSPVVDIMCTPGTNPNYPWRLKLSSGDKTIYFDVKHKWVGASRLIFGPSQALLDREKLEANPQELGLDSSEFTDSDLELTQMTIGGVMIQLNQQAEDWLTANPQLREVIDFSQMPQLIVIKDKVYYQGRFRKTPRMLKSSTLRDLPRSSTLIMSPTGKVFMEKGPMPLALKSSSILQYEVANNGLDLAVGLLNDSFAEGLSKLVKTPSEFITNYNFEDISKLKQALENINDSLVKSLLTPQIRLLNVYRATISSKAHKLKSKDSGFGKVVRKTIKGKVIPSFEFGENVMVFGGGDYFQHRGYVARDTKSQVDSVAGVEYALVRGLLVIRHYDEGSDTISDVNSEQFKILSQFGVFYKGVFFPRLRADKAPNSASFGPGQPISVYTKVEQRDGKLFIDDHKVKACKQMEAGKAVVLRSASGKTKVLDSQADRPKSPWNPIDNLADTEYSPTIKPSLISALEPYFVFVGKPVTEGTGDKSIAFNSISFKPGVKFKMIGAKTVPPRFTKVTVTSTKEFVIDDKIRIQIID